MTSDICNCGCASLQVAKDLARKKERERCAKIASETVLTIFSNCPTWGSKPINVQFFNTEIVHKIWGSDS